MAALFSLHGRAVSHRLPTERFKQVEANREKRFKFSKEAKEAFDKLSIADAAFLAALNARQASLKSMPRPSPFSFTKEDPVEMLEELSQESKAQATIDLEKNTSAESLSLKEQRGDIEGYALQEERQEAGAGLVLADELLSFDQKVRELSLDLSLQAGELSSREIFDELALEAMSEDVWDASERGLLLGKGNVLSDESYQMKLSIAQAKRGFYFNLDLSPKKEAKFELIRQNYFFLIDRSNSIPKERYQVFLESVARALDYLNEDDSFNILLFDRSVERFSEHSVKKSAKAIELAKDFLYSSIHGGLFATTDILRSLDEIVPKVLREKELNTAILLSDGDSYLSEEEQRETIIRWTDKNAGKVSLFSFASGQENKLSVLDLLSRLNKGSLSYLERDEALPEDLEKLMQRIRFPLAKDLSASIISQAKGFTYQLYPRKSQLPNLYAGETYKLEGYVNSLEDFHLFLQGKYYDDWLIIKKRVDFTRAKRADLEEMRRRQAEHLAYDYYESFLRKGEVKYLEKAKELLRHFNLSASFL